MTRKNPRLPPEWAWPSLPRTIEDAQALGRPFFWTGKLCREKHVGEIGTPFPRYTSDNVCVEHRRLSNERARLKAQSKWRRDHGIYPGWRDGVFGYPMRRPPWQTADELADMKAFREDPLFEVDHIDHIVPVNHWKYDNEITGLDTRANIQHLPQDANNAKGARLPDPANYKVKAGRDLTHAECVEFIRLGMAVWSIDVDDDGTVHFERYRMLANGVERIEALPEAAE